MFADAAALIYCALSGGASTCDALFRARCDDLQSVGANEYVLIGAQSSAPLGDSKIY